MKNISEVLGLTALHGADVVARLKSGDVIPVERAFGGRTYVLGYVKVFDDNTFEVRVLPFKDIDPSGDAPTGLTAAVIKLIVVSLQITRV